MFNSKKHSAANFQQIATKVSVITIISNVILSILKLFAGFIANSGAMVSDAIHSASDVFSTIIVMIGVYFSSRESDETHPYGHERIESVAAIVLAVILFITGAAICVSATKNIISGNYNQLETPGKLAIIAAVISIIGKEAMYWYTRYYAIIIDSSALMADAWHHRSDALSSICALIGITFARIGYPVMDSVASLVIFLFIAKASWDIFKDAMDKMVDHACDEETQQRIYDCIMKNEAVLGIDVINTRIFGNRIYVDVEILADASHTLLEAHNIAETVHDDIEQNFRKVKHIMVHVNPA